MKRRRNDDSPKHYSFSPGRRRVVPGGGFILEHKTAYTENITILFTDSHVHGTSL